MTFFKYNLHLPTFWVTPCIKKNKKNQNFDILGKICLVQPFFLMDNLLILGNFEGTQSVSSDYQSTQNFTLISKMYNFIPLFWIFRDLWHFKGTIWRRGPKSDKFDL